MSFAWVSLVTSKIQHNFNNLHFRWYQQNMSQMSKNDPQQQNTILQFLLSNFAVQFLVQYNAMISAINKQILIMRSWKFLVRKTLNSTCVFHSFGNIIITKKNNHVLCEQHFHILFIFKYDPKGTTEHTLLSPHDVQTGPTESNWPKQGLQRHSMSRSVARAHCVAPDSSPPLAHKKQSMCH